MPFSGKRLRGYQNFLSTIHLQSTITITTCIITHSKCSRGRCRADISLCCIYRTLQLGLERIQDIVVNLGIKVLSTLYHVVKALLFTSHKILNFNSALEWWRGFHLWWHSPVQCRKWSPTAKWSRTANDPWCGPQMILLKNINGMEFGFQDVF